MGAVLRSDSKSRGDRPGTTCSHNTLSLLLPPPSGSWVPPNECATLLSLAPELGVAEIGQDLPKLQE
jgi:hypothetical protein